MVMNGYLTLGGGHRMWYTHDILQSCTLENCIILLTNATPINSIKLKEKYLDVRSKALKLLDKKIRKKLLDIDMLYPTKKLLHCKGNNQQYEKITFRMGENIWKPNK